MQPPIQHNHARYDASGARARKTVGSNVTDYVYDINGEVAWEILNGSVNRAYVRANGQLVAEYYTGTTYFVHRDHLGSTRLLTGMNQSIVQNLDYLPFGQLNSSDSGITTHKFTGDEMDSETGLDHTDFRQYASTQGRWLSPDPAGIAAADPSNPQSWNRYAYVLNNPLGMVDPTGLCGFDAMNDEGGFVVCIDSQYGADYSGTPPTGPPNGANPLFSGGCTPGTGAKNQATNCGYQFGDSQKSLPAWYVKDITQVQCGEMAQQIVDCTNLPSALQDPRYIGLIKDTKGVPSGAYGSWSIFLKAMDITAFTSFGISIQTLGPPSSSAKCVSAAKAMGNWEKVHKRANPPSYLVEALSECAN